jgi:hypothetical protein
MTVVAARTLFTKARRQITGPGEVLLIARMLGWACALRVLKHTMPLPRLVRLARWSGRVRGRSTDYEEKVVTLARWACRPMQWLSGGNCLERGLVTYRYLAASSANPMLIVGVARGGNDIDLVRGHAWVTVDGRALDETDESLAGFHCVVAFRADGTQA